MSFNAIIERKHLVISLSAPAETVTLFGSATVEATREIQHAMLTLDPDQARMIGEAKCSWQVVSLENAPAALDAADMDILARLEDAPGAAAIVRFDIRRKLISITVIVPSETVPKIQHLAEQHLATDGTELVISLVFDGFSKAGATSDAPTWSDFSTGAQPIATRKVSFNYRLKRHMGIAAPLGS